MNCCSRLKFSLKFDFISCFPTRYCSTNPKFVNKARSGRSNFEKDFGLSHVYTSGFQKLLLGIGSGITSIADPRRGDMIAVMGESTGVLAFEYIRSKMLYSEEGRKVLEDKPRISSGSVNLQHLRDLPEGTLGKAYSNFLEKYNYTPDERLAVRFVDDLELAYVAQRYREVHDLFHTLLDMPTDMLGEVTVKWIEAIQTRLPMCVTGALFGPLRLAPKLHRSYSTIPNITIENQLRKDFENKNLKFKKHPGSMNLPAVSLPEELDNHINSILKESDIHISDKNVKDFKTTIYKRISLLEGQKKELMYENLKNKILLRLEKKGKLKNLTVDNINAIVSQRANKSLEHLEKMAKPLTFNKKLCLLYLRTRAPLEYSVLIRIFNEIKKRDPSFKPASLFDFGSGVGTVTWAASKLWSTSLREYVTVDASQDMNDLAFRIIQKDKRASFIEGFNQRQSLPVTDIECDLVVSAFTFLQLKDYETRVEALRLLWNKTLQYLVLVENGTNDGFEVINEAREALLNASTIYNFRCHVFAPCPHNHPCPRLQLPSRSPCNFLSKYKNLTNKMDGKQFDDALYSYVVFKKGKRELDDEQWPRVVREVKLRRKRAHCIFCTKEGQLVNAVVTKSKLGDTVYRYCKKLLWGDLFHGQVSLPNVRNTSKSDTNSEEALYISNDVKQ